MRPINDQIKAGELRKTQVQSLKNKIQIWRTVINVIAFVLSPIALFLIIRFAFTLNPFFFLICILTAIGFLVYKIAKVQYQSNINTLNLLMNVFIDNGISEYSE